MSIISQYYANTVKDVLSEEPQPLCHRRLPEPVKIDPQMGLPAEAFDPVKKGWTTFEQRNTRSLFLHSLCSTRKLVALDCVNSIQINLFGKCPQPMEQEDTAQCLPLAKKKTEKKNNSR